MYSTYIGINSYTICVHSVSCNAVSRRGALPCVVSCRTVLYRSAPHTVIRHWLFADHGLVLHHVVSIISVLQCTAPNT